MNLDGQWHADIEGGQGSRRKFAWACTAFSLIGCAVYAAVWCLTS